MSITKKQKQQITEALDFLRNPEYDVLNMKYSGDNKYLLHFYSSIKLLQDHGYKDAKSTLDWYRNNLALMLSPINGHNYVSPDPY